MVAWVLNLDAEDELSAKGGRHTPTRAMRLRIDALATRLPHLIAPGDVVLREGMRADGQLGDAWCPTPRARAILANAGATPPPAPAVEVLRAVNHREFSARLGQTLPGAAYVAHADAVRATFAASPSVESWLLKRPLGFAGRGRRKVSVHRLTDADAAWIEASVRQHGGLQVEPYVERLGDFAIHGFVSESGDVRLGAPTIQVCDAHGAWQGTTIAPEDALSAAEHRALLAEARQTADALFTNGYFGPFGLDAYRWQPTGGPPAFNARSEINARYSMGWAIGMRGWRPPRS